MNTCRRIRQWFRLLSWEEYPVLPGLFPEPDERTKETLDRLWTRLKGVT